MAQPSLNLYFLALLPPEPLLTQIRELKQFFADTYQSKAALRSPAHITLHMPFQWREDKESVFESVFPEFAKANQLNNIRLTGFGAFKPRVIYVDVDADDSLYFFQKDLVRLMKLKLNIFNANYKDQGYKPHLTVAFRDLRPAAFDEAWKEFKDREFRGDFKPDALVLLKHNQKHWEVFRRYPFQEFA